MIYDLNHQVLFHLEVMDSDSLAEVINSSSLFGSDESNNESSNDSSSDCSVSGYLRSPPNSSGAIHANSRGEQTLGQILEQILAEKSMLSRLLILQAEAQYIRFKNQYREVLDMLHVEHAPLGALPDEVLEMYSDLVRLKGELTALIIDRNRAARRYSEIMSIPIDTLMCNLPLMFDFDLPRLLQTDS